ncbi:MAG: hypothetical protein KDI61_05125 [Alphaproteobacteria bacterium]|nr:hypothetical protein [Alphaproteobacteria bacterium]MCB1839627.1 hypothetical protein [Alphaproteobacteria bacterium]
MTKPSKTKYVLSVLATSALMVTAIETIRPQQVLAKAMEAEGMKMPAAFALASGDIDGVRKMAEEFVCGEKRIDLRNRIINAVDYIVDPVDNQVALLDEVRTKAMENDKVIQSACESYSALGDDFLSMMEKRHLVVTTALQVMDNVQPSIKAFYTSLSPEQVARLKDVAPPAIAKRL